MARRRIAAPDLPRPRAALDRSLATRLEFPVMDLQRLASLSLPDANAAPRRLGDFWRERRVVLVFARHFG